MVGGGKVQDVPVPLESHLIWKDAKTAEQREGKIYLASGITCNTRLDGGGERRRTSHGKSEW